MTLIICFTLQGIVFVALIAALIHTAEKELVFRSHFNKSCYDRKMEDFNQNERLKKSMDSHKYRDPLNERRW